jgi:hypothetical protein
MVGLVPDAALVEAYRHAGGRGRRIAQLHVCWAASRDEAVEVAARWWPNGGLPPALLTELERPRDLAQAATLVEPAHVARAVVCGPDPEPYVRALLRFAAAGYDRVYVHQVGPDQEGFLGFWSRQLQPALA